MYTFFFFTINKRTRRHMNWSSEAVTSCLRGQQSCLEWLGRGRLQAQRTAQKSPKVLSRVRAGQGALRGFLEEAASACPQVALHPGGWSRKHMLMIHRVTAEHLRRWGCAAEAPPTTSVPTSRPQRRSSAVSRHSPGRLRHTRQERTQRIKRVSK